MKTKAYKFQIYYIDPKGGLGWHAETLISLLDIYYLMDG